MSTQGLEPTRLSQLELKAVAVYVAVGQKAEAEAAKALQSLRRFHSSSELPAVVLGVEPSYKPSVRGADGNVRLSRILKLGILENPEVRSYEYLLYLDADTRVDSPCLEGFELLRRGWDLAIAISSRQERDCLGHLKDPEERSATFEALGGIPVQLQAGVMYIRRNDRTLELFRAWRAEWRRFGGLDQGALLRALSLAPVKICLLGRPYNCPTELADGLGPENKPVILHNFGAAR